MASIISSTFYGKCCPLAETFNNNEKFEKLPMYVPLDHEYALKVVCGNDSPGKMDISTLNDIIPRKWFREIDEYLDVPILGFLGKYGVFIESDVWWMELVKVKGYLQFLHRFTINLSDINWIIRWSIERKKFIVENGGKLTETTYTYAAADNNYLEILQFLREKKCPMASDDCLRTVARRGHLETLKWIINGNPVWKDFYSQNREDERFCTNSSDMGHPDITDWIQETFNMI